MKVNMELDLTPEELRRLFGLPDVSPINDMVVVKLGEQVEKGLDGTHMKNMAQAMLKGGVQGFEAYQNLLTTMFRMGRTRPEDAAEPPVSATGQAATGSEPGSPGANTGGGTR